MGTIISKLSVSGGGGSGGEVTIKDSPNLDAFSRLRISNPLTLFSSQFTYDENPLLFERFISDDGAITYDSGNGCITMASATIGGANTFMQSFEYFPYQPSKSQLVFITFNMKSGDASNRKYAGLSDGINGIEFYLFEDNPHFAIYSSTTAGNEVKSQGDWNLDILNGTGPSGITLDFTKTQILVIDFQALYVGRVRVGFDIGGKIIYAHEFLHANILDVPYLRTANLPIRVGIENTTGNVNTIDFICCAVVSEGGTEDTNLFGYSFSQQSGSRAIAPGTSFTHMLSLRPRATFNGLTNRIKLAFIDVEIYNAGNQPVYWQLVLGLPVSGGSGYQDVNVTYSATEYNADQSASGTAGIVIDAGYVASGGSVKTVTNTAVNSRYPITLDAGGNPRLLGTISLIARSLSGTQNCYGSIKFREIR
jgi:hypothetical protein